MPAVERSSNIVGEVTRIVDATAVPVLARGFASDFGLADQTEVSYRRLHPAVRGDHRNGNDVEGYSYDYEGVQDGLVATDASGQTVPMLSWSTAAKQDIRKGKLLVCVVCAFEIILQRDVTSKRERKTMAMDTKSNSMKETDKELPFPSKLLVLVDKWVN